MLTANVFGVCFAVFFKGDFSYVSECRSEIDGYSLCINTTSSKIIFLFKVDTVVSVPSSHCFMENKGTAGTRPDHHSLPACYVCV